MTIYHQNGKQVLRRGAHFADAVSVHAAARITRLLNLFAWTDWPSLLFAALATFVRRKPCQPAVRRKPEFSNAMYVPAISNLQGNPICQPATRSS